MYLVTTITMFFNHIKGIFYILKYVFIKDDVFLKLLYILAELK